MRRIVLLTLPVVSLSACSSGENAATDTTAQTSDSAAAATAAWSSAGAATDSLQTPESARYDADLDVFFISNINGNPSAKDGNGFIARVEAGNTSAVTKFIEGGKNGVTLNAPKGMAIVGDTLWVTDIDAVRAFNKRTGAAIATIDLQSMRAEFLNDIVVAPDGAIYVTDTGIRFDANGQMSHPGSDQIFKIVGRKTTVAIKGDSTLNAPNGIAWDSKNNQFILAPFNAPTISTWKATDSTVTWIGAGPGGYDGVEVLSDGRILVSSWADSAVHALRDGRFQKVIGNVDGPADIGIDTKRNVVAVPRFNAGRVEYFTITP